MDCDVFMKLEQTASKTFFLSENISVTVCNVSQYHISTANDGIRHHF